MKASFIAKTSCILIGIILAISAPASAAVFNVSDQAAFQDALTIAASNGQADTINVSAGTINISGSLIYDRALSENYPLTIIGAGVASTILNGDASNVVLALWSTGATADNNVHFTVQGITFQNGHGFSDGGLDMDGWDGNMTIENCNFSSNYSDNGGAGVSAYSSEGTVTLRGCVFTSNEAYEGEGGGAFIASPSGTIVVENNDFTGNYIYYGDGIGVYIWGDITTVTGNTFVNNTTDGEYSDGGGGAYIDGDFVTVTNNTFTENSGGSSSDGGGANIHGYYSITMTGNVFTGNTAEYGGGGAKVYCHSGDITMADNVFTGNIAGEGGGAEIDAREGLLMVNNVFSNNTATSYYGGGVDLSLNSLTSPATITNNTFTQNSAPLGGGLYILIWENTDTLNFYNNIVYGNTAPTGGDLYLRDDWNGDGVGSIVNLFNNDFNSLYAQDGDNLTQANNIDSDPLLTPGFHLNPGSPCIEAGNNAAPGLPAIDMDGETRIINANVDIGADEYNGPVPSPPVPDIKANGLDTPVAITQGENLSVTITLDPGTSLTQAADPADWWVIAQAPTGVFSYAVGGAWQPRIHATHQGDLFEIGSPYEVLNMSNLPPGSYTFHFGVDTNMNGVIDMGELYADSVAVTITPL